MCLKFEPALYNYNQPSMINQVDVCCWFNRKSLFSTLTCCSSRFSLLNNLLQSVRLQRTPRSSTPAAVGEWPGSDEAAVPPGDDIGGVVGASERVITDFCGSGVGELFGLDVAGGGEDNAANAVDSTPFVVGGGGNSGVAGVEGWAGADSSPWPISSYGMPLTRGCRSLVPSSSFFASLPSLASEKGKLALDLRCSFQIVRIFLSCGSRTKSKSSTLSSMLLASK